MDLFIRIKDGQPFEHPIIESNLKKSYPGIDTQNLPPEFARFQRTAKPTIGPYEIYNGAIYEFDGELVTEVHSVTQMTEEQKAEKQNLVKQKWSESGFKSWIFNSELCLFEPPIPYPETQKLHKWDEDSVSWVEVT